MTKQQHVERALRKWQRLLGLQHWCLNTDFVDGYEFEDQYGEAVTGNCTSDQATLTARIAIAMQQRLSGLEDTARHELLHCLISEIVTTAMSCANELSGEAKTLMLAEIAKADERLVRMLERAFDRVAPQGGETNSKETGRR